MKKYFTFLCLLLLLMCLDITAFAAPPDADYELLFADEFDKEIDLNIWKYRTGERLGGYNYPENVYIKDGKMYHEMRYETRNGTEQLTGGGIISNEFFGYGYYETKCRLFGATGGMHSSFWSMGFGGDGEKTPKYNQVYEIDGYEIDSHKKNRITCNINLKINAVTGIPGTPVTDFPTDTEFTFGYEWLPNQINWYLNGELIQSKSGNEIPIHYAQQNLWITGLANASLSGEIDRAKLPGDAWWDYVHFYAMPLKDINLLGASEFEYNENPDHTPKTSLQHPMSWMELGDTEASFLEWNDSAVSGNHVLSHHSDKKYTVTTAQRLYYIPNGNYSFSVYAMSSGGQKTAKIRISDFDGETVKEIDIPKSDTMTKLEITDIEITDNGAYVEIISEANGGQWLKIDNPSLYATHGKEVEKAIPYTTDLSGYTVGETFVSTKSDGFNQSGAWQGSGLAGYKGEKSIFVYEQDGDAAAEFTITAPKDGEYDIRFYKVGHSNSGKKCHVYYKLNGKTVDGTADLTQGGWQVIGTEKLKKGDKVVVGIDSKNGGLLRASAASIATKGSVVLKDVLLLELESPKVWAHGIKKTVDPENLSVVPTTKNDRTMVPVRFIAENLGATVDYVDETEEIVIRLADNTVTLKVNSAKMNVNGKEIVLDVPAYVRDGRTFVPLRAISEGLNQKVSWIPDKFVIIGDKEVTPTKELSTELDTIGKQ
ncbi:MAG: family 16 glycosylhydrolase [Clostridia bacterium]|nr:family 16 glycosylhydrolase [Clostridia bacterium]